MSQLRSVRLFILLSMVHLMLSSVSFSQNVVSPQVHADGRVTFRLRAPNARQVAVSLNGSKLEMTRAGNGVWEATSDILPPQIYDYSFTADGTTMLDPANRMVKKWLTMVSMVEIPGSPPRLTEFQNVPHGTVQRVVYDSKSVGRQRPAMIYTPPGYESSLSQHFSLLVLMHGYGDDESAWTEVGRAHFIADNLIAAGEIQPVIIVMPYGHPVPLDLRERPADYFGSNNDLCERDITQDLLPFLESRYRVRKDADGRSIAGLSMGGGHAIDTGLRNLDTFSSIGAFSAATPQLETADLLKKYSALTGPDPAANRLKHFWIPIGDQDFLLAGNEKFVGQLKSANIRHTYVVTPGGHEWKLWRDDLPQFLKLVAGK